MTTRDFATNLLVLRVLKDAVADRDRDLRDHAGVVFDQVGMRDIGVIGDTQIGHVQLTKGRATPKVTDPDALLAWVKKHNPAEVVTTEKVRGSYVSALLAEAKRDGVVVDPVTGEVIPGIEVTEAAPILAVKPSEDARDVIATALAEGRLTWEQVATAAIEAS